MRISEEKVLGRTYVNLEYGVHDESDEMLSRGFKDQIYDDYRYLPPELQVMSTTAQTIGHSNEPSRTEET
ncbi:hypothetical protein Dimus_030074 [Dionaea muscipula]